MKSVITLLLIFCFNQFLFGIDLHLNFEKSRDIKEYSKTSLILVFPNKEKTSLFNDTTSNFKNKIDNLNFEKGKYNLEIIHIIKTDTVKINYDFEIKGNEKRLEIDLSLSENINKRRKDNSWKIVNQYYYNMLTVKLIYLPDENIIIKPITKIKINSRPVFQIANNTNEKIRGEYFESYFWGWMERYFQNKWGLKRTGIIDLNFIGGTPLNAMDTTITHVGSFNRHLSNLNILISDI